MHHWPSSTEHGWRIPLISAVQSLHEYVRQIPFWLETVLDQVILQLLSLEFWLLCLKLLCVDGCQCHSIDQLIAPLYHSHSIDVQYM